LICIPLCGCICWRLRRTSRQRRDAQQRLAQLLAQRQQRPQDQMPDIFVPQPNVFPASFYGIPTHFLENFPIYTYERRTPSSTGSTPPPSLTGPTYHEDLSKSTDRLLTNESDELIAENVDDSRVCVICLDEYMPGERIRLLPCVHRFHVDCIDQWLKKHTTCPLCKLDLITQEFQM